VALAATFLRHSAARSACPFELLRREGVVGQRYVDGPCTKATQRLAPSLRTGGIGRENVDRLSVRQRERLRRNNVTILDCGSENHGKIPR